jgi:putative endonuclease
MKSYFVYIMSSQGRVLYIGVTSKLEGRVFQHKAHFFGGFTAKYNVSNLVYFERYSNVYRAIGREKELKGWLRQKKFSLIESTNPNWKDLSYGWYQKISMAQLELPDNERIFPELSGRRQREQSCTRAC